MARRQKRGDKLFMKGFGERLRHLREAYGERFGEQYHTRAAWARRLWVSAANYGRWESGASLPRLDDMLRISLLFRVDPNYLIAGVLSDHLERWLHHALMNANPELWLAADYWRNQSELFEQANRALADEAKARKIASASPPRVVTKR